MVRFEDRLEILGEAAVEPCDTTDSRGDAGREVRRSQAWCV